MLAEPNDKLHIVLNRHQQLVQFNIQCLCHPLDGADGRVADSRTKISAGLTVLTHQGVIERAEGARSTYQICKFDPSSGWAKFPASKLYRDGRIVFFDELHLRKRAELDALKLWYLFAARRDNNANLAKLTYDQIEELSGIARDRIKSGLSLLAANGLVHVEQIPSRHSEYGIANAYRLPQIDSSRHMGSTGRGLIDEVSFDDEY